MTRNNDFNWNRGHQLLDIRTNRALTSRKGRIRRTTTPTLRTRDEVVQRLKDKGYEIQVEKRVYDLIMVDSVVYGSVDYFAQEGRYGVSILYDSNSGFNSVLIQEKLYNDCREGGIAVTEDSDSISAGQLNAMKRVTSRLEAQLKQEGER